MKVKGRSGFTMVELLTVIAIIAILAAIIFPVFSAVRKNVYKAQCTSNLHSLAQAITMYKNDYRLYPDALLGYVPLGNNGAPMMQVDPGTGQQVPAVRTFLYPQYIKDLSGFRCPTNPETTISLKDPKLLARGVHGTLGELLNVAYFTWDSYDGSKVPHTLENAPYVVHYLRKWTPGPVSAADPPRQLIYRNPPDNTVVTWCTYHRNYQRDAAGNWVPETGMQDLVLFLDGRVKPMPTTLTARENNAHGVTPNS